MPRRANFLPEGLGNASGLIQPLLCVRKDIEGGIQM
jgi:hypothetical protein